MHNLKFQRGVADAGSELLHHKDWVLEQSLASDCTTAREVAQAAVTLY